MLGYKRRLLVKYMIPRKRFILVRLCFAVLTLSCLFCGWCLSEVTSQALMPPIFVPELEHFRNNRDLKRYLDDIQVLIEPSSVECDDAPLLVLVTSSPTHFVQRQAIRATWGPHFPTYFIMGHHGRTVKDLHADYYVEAKQYSDLIVYNFKDHYQNLTLKTALMLRWTLRRCSPQMLFKTDDDVLVNPWTMKQVLEDNRGKELVGYLVEGARTHREQRNRWFSPSWLLPLSRIPRYLSGTGYLLQGKLVEEILTAAYKVPMINLEDVYFTYLVSVKALNLTLTHDRRLSPFKPWLASNCVFWGLASTHSLSATEILDKWQRIKYISKKYDNNNSTCEYFLSNLWNEWFLY